MTTSVTVIFWGKVIITFLKNKAIEIWSIIKTALKTVDLSYLWMIPTIILLAAAVAVAILILAGVGYLSVSIGITHINPYTEHLLHEYACVGIAVTLLSGATICVITALYKTSKKNFTKFIGWIKVNWRDAINQTKQKGTL